ncbi:NAD(P)-binding domain-containing protein [Bacillus sp. Marseille-P3661]|uniref:NAD(P)-binding domain-containing protein n=1 Tax=Bacillus sp. Marseille-P3661 TaxID=1936234 RepID=UPI000C833E34|nr:NAD(P)-binding domain-containing protein [Bacillus sp. Marseille-P3661]
MISTTMVGIGRLGRALMSQWDKIDEEIGIFHPSDDKVKSFTAHFNKAVPICGKKLTDMKTIILALPAAQVSKFIQQSHYSHVTYVNMATALNTAQLQKEFPDIQIVSMKFVGHAQDLYVNGDGYFITESYVPEHVKSLFSTIGLVKKGDPEIVNQINKWATYYGIKAAVELETHLKGKHFDDKLINRALSSITPEVIKSYQKGDLGHFAQTVAKEVKESLGNNHKMG